MPDLADNGQGLALLRSRVEHRDAWVEVDLTAIVENARALEALCSNGGRAAPVVKANAYGHGAVPVARALAAAGFDGFCVATLDEALELRAAGLQGRIILLYEPPLGALAAAIDAVVEITVGSPEAVDAVLGVVARDRSRVSVQLKIDTGMSRQGMRYDALGPVADKLRALAPMVTGIWTHLADGADQVAAGQQLGRFDQSVAELRGLGITAPRHSSGSAAILSGLGTHYELIRPGLALYGIRPAEMGERGSLPIRLCPAMSVRARPERLVTLPPGTPVGYGSTFTTSRLTRLATLPLGYADGLRRNLGTAGAFAVCGSARAPIVGRISMDSCAVDVTDLEGITRRSVFTLLGDDGGNRITSEELARLGGTIPQEILLGFDDRLPFVHRV